MIRYEVRGPVAFLTMNRPERLNAFDIPMAREMGRALTAAEKDPRVRVVVLSGAGGNFSAGGDVKAMYAALTADPGDYIRRLSRSMHTVISRIARLEKPVIASVAGVAAGGSVGLAFVCDLIIAAETARFIMAFVRIGGSPDGGTTYFLSRLLGPKKAAELAFTGDPLEAAEALRLGVVNCVVPEEKLAEITEQWAERLAAQPPRAVAAAKALIRRGFQEGLEKHLEMESTTAASTARSDDFREGVSAFCEKRPPRFRTGRR